MWYLQSLTEAHDENSKDLQALLNFERRLIFAEEYGEIILHFEELFQQFAGLF